MATFEVMNSTRALKPLCSVASLLTATFYQGIHDVNNKFWNIASTERYILRMCCCNVPSYKWKVHNFLSWNYLLCRKVSYLIDTHSKLCVGRCMKMTYLYLCYPFLEKLMHEVWFMQMKEQDGEKKHTVGTHSYADCWKTLTPSIANMMAIKKHFNNVSFRELFVIHSLSFKLWVGNSCVKGREVKSFNVIAWGCVILSACSSISLELCRICTWITASME